jgi:hypothetical protein
LLKTCSKTTSSNTRRARAENPTTHQRQKHKTTARRKCHAARQRETFKRHAENANIAPTALQKPFDACFLSTGL